MQALFESCLSPIQLITDRKAGVSGNRGESRGGDEAGEDDRMNATVISVRVAAFCYYFFYFLGFSLRPDAGKVVNGSFGTF